jgi:DNA primase
MKKRNLLFKDVLNIIKKELNLSDFCSFTKDTLFGIFGGAYNKISRPTKITSNKVLDSEILKEYCNKFNIRFFQDGINFHTQKKFNIGFDTISQRITVPWFNDYDELIGIMGRYNGDEKDIKKWMPIIPFLKLNELYGYSQNYEFLQECDVIYIGESEKFVLQCDSMGINTALGLGRNAISSEQIKKIIRFQPKKILYCLDEGLPEENSIINVKATEQFLKYSDIEVGYVYDRFNEFLGKESKDSPTDNGIEIFKAIINNCVYYV